ncbi:hypothetical protein SCHPADRAFT_942442 [Schizopora paradoxa]|uniref:Uncharacterized protein n=1 Tax=Schizopora paradoxa TaxID=27342 RepID=A0A0H2RGJ3_9AGAM|nr:hypothetical protein SCHPADRAFT_942442 [Schizopora paradoxa]
MSSHAFPSGAANLLFNKLCPEILGEIFQACIATSGERSGPSLSSAPINISQVCRRWRQVALSTPRLWSSFSLLHRRYIENDSSDDYHCIKRTIPVIKNWIERSSCAPLDFDIYMRLHEFMKDLAEDIESLLEILIDQRDRWRSVTIIYDFPLSRWFDVSFSDMYMLRHLQLECCSTPDCVARLDLTRSPKLETLFLQGNFKMIGSGNIPSLANVHLAPNTGVPSLSAFPTLQDCFDILRRAPSLQIFDASCEGSSDEDFFEHIQMNNLHGFHLRLGSTHVVSKNQLSSFFEHLTVPSLKSLHVSCHSLIDYSPINANLLGLITRSQAPISTLILDTPAVREEQLISLLRLLPGLKTLQLGGMRTLDKVFSNLTLAAANEIEDDICPQLERIHIKDIDNMSLSGLSDCVVSRWRGPTKSKEGHGVFKRSLREVAILNCTPSDETPGIFRDLKVEGLILELRLKPYVYV